MAHSVQLKWKAQNNLCVLSVYGSTINSMEGKNTLKKNSCLEVSNKMFKTFFHVTIMVSVCKVMRWW